MYIPLARQNFYHEINRPDERIDLAKAALYIAQEEYPQVDPAKYLNALDTMAAEVRERLPAQRYPLRVIQTINQYLYSDLGFTGNTADYYDPRNSFLNQVMDRRTGIPITLSLVYLEIARRIDFPMVGVGMPGHFLIRPDFEDAGIWVDAFNAGEILFPEDCKELLSRMYGHPVPLLPEFLEPVSPRQFLARMLSNLKLIYVTQNDAPRALEVVDRILLLFPDSLTELRDRGILYYQDGYVEEAIEDLEAYLAQVPEAEDAGDIRQLVESLRSDLQQ